MNSRKTDHVILNIRIFWGQSPGNTAGHADSQEQKDDDSNSYTGCSSSIAEDEIFKQDETSGCVDFVCWLTSSFSTALSEFLAASIGNVSSVGESGCSFPVSEVVDTAAFEVALHDIPSFGHSLVVFFVVIFQAVGHCFGDDFPGVTPEDVDCNGDSDQRQQNQGQHSSVGVHHTWVFRASSAAAEEGDDEHEGADDDQDDRSVEVGAAEKVQVLGHVDLDISTNADEGHTRQEKDEVEEKDNVLDKNVTTPHLGRLWDS